jgi:hypothetical protein
MKIEFDTREIIPLENFKLNWRWDFVHNPTILSVEKEQIETFSEIESKRINKIIDYFESESNLRKSFESSDWFTANSETELSKKKFSDNFRQRTQNYNENLFISWNRTTCVYTTKEIFIKYWDDFCYPSSDDITIISELTNWVYFYNHIGVGIFWKRKT